MTLNTQSNATAIVRDLAAKSGIKLTASGVETLALIAQSEFNWDAGEITGRDASGASIPAADWFAAKLQSNPNWKSGPAVTTTTPKHENMTQRGLRLNTANRRDRTAEAAKLVAEHGNPWMSSSLNRSRQGLVANCDPALAERLPHEASL